MYVVGQALQFTVTLFRIDVLFMLFKDEHSLCFVALDAPD